MSINTNGHVIPFTRSYCCCLCEHVVAVTPQTERFQFFLEDLCDRCWTELIQGLERKKEQAVAKLPDLPLPPAA